MKSTSSKTIEKRLEKKQTDLSCWIFLARRSDSLQRLSFMTGTGILSVPSATSMLQNWRTGWYGHSRNWDYRASTKDVGVKKSRRGMAKRPKRADAPVAAMYTILERYAYTGAAVGGIREQVVPCKRASVKKDRADWIVVPNMHEAIITPEEYELAQKVIGEKIIYSSRPVFLATSRCPFNYKEQEIVRQSVIRIFSYYK